MLTLLWNVIITVMVFLYVEFVGFGFMPTNTLHFTRITQGGTFSRHLEDIRQLADSWEGPAPTEHDLQLMRLREFAANLNAGGTEISDLRIIRILGPTNRDAGFGFWCDIARRVRHTSFEVVFKHEEDFNNAGLIEEMLAFTGIPEESIRIDLSQTGNIIRYGGVEHFEFMLTNRAVYEIAEPYLRLREFAMYANSDAVYLDYVVVISIVDMHRQWYPAGLESSHRFSIRLSYEAFFNRELRYEMLAFAGIEQRDVIFQWTRVNPWEADQDILGPLHEQSKRLDAFMDLVMVRSVRRNIVMDMVTWSLAPPDFRGDGSGFIVGLAEYNFYNTELRETLLAFTGIAGDNIKFEPPLILSIGWHPTRGCLTPGQQSHFDTLEAFQEKVNAPFWYDRYQHDPVIVRINLTGRWRLRSPGHFILHNYHIMLYDPDLAGRNNISIAWRTRALRREIVATTGIRNIRFRSFEPPAWQA